MTPNVWLESRENDAGFVQLEVKRLARSTGSRAAGRDLRAMVENVVDTDRKGVVLDFVGVETCGSAFVDELVGKLIEKYGIVAFSQHVRIVNLAGVGERGLFAVCEKLVLSAAKGSQYPFVLEWEGSGALVSEN